MNNTLLKKTTTQSYINRKLSKEENMYYLLITFYCLLTFLLSLLIYLYSMKIGYEGLGVPLFGGGDDGKFYYTEALNIAEGRSATLTSIHALILGWILKIFHTDQVYMLRAFNYIGNICTLLVSLKVISILQLNKKELYAGMLFIVLLTYYPSFLLNSSISIIRDSWIVFYYILSILLLFNFLRAHDYGTKFMNLMALIFSLWMLMGYRNYALLGFLISTFIYLSFIHYRSRRPHYKRIFLYMVVGVSFIYTFLRGVKFPIVERSISDILSIRTDGIELYGGGGQMYIFLDQPNVLMFYLNYFYSILSNVLGPLPWQFTGISSVILFFGESLLFMFVIIRLINLRHLLSKYDYFLIINSVVWFMLIGIFNDNLGTAARLRMVGWVPLFIVFAKVYGEHYVNQRKVGKEKTLIGMKNFGKACNSRSTLVK